MQNTAKIIRHSRKWTNEENLRLLNFVKNNKPIEKPTRQIYYEKFTNGDPMQIEWRLARYKVKNWKASYKKAIDAIFNKVAINKDMVLRMCPYFDDLEQIFGNKQISDTETIQDNELDFDCSSDGMFLESVSGSTKPAIKLWPSIDDIDFSDDSLLEPSSSTKFKIFKQTYSEESRPQFDNEVASSKEETSFEAPLLEPSSSTKPREAQRSFPVKSSKRGVKKTYSQTVILDVLRNQSGLIEALKQHCELQTHKLKQELQIRKIRIDLMLNQLNFEKEKHLKEMQIKERQIESNEKIKLLEIDLERERLVRDFEMQEKIALNELEIKERLAMKEFESNKHQIMH